jgi:hypothetical protein
MNSKHVLYAVVALAALSTGASIAQENDTVAVKAAVNRSLALLQASNRASLEKSGCVTCHHEQLPALTFALARRRGFVVDDALTRARVQATLARWTPQREHLFQASTGAVNGQVMSTGYALLGLAADEVLPNAITDAMVHYIVARQMSDGRFRAPTGGGGGRPPLEYSDVTATALSVRILELYARPGLREEAARIIRQARDWLRSIVPHATEESTFQLQGLAWSGADQRDIARRVSALVAEQRADGGWAQLSTLSSDAYATGQALVALHQAGRLSTTSAVYRKGLAFLLNTQFDDGSWHVTSRGRGTTRYYQSGFPHGGDQFISAAGSAWATSALLLSLDELPRPR